MRATEVVIDETWCPEPQRVLLFMPRPKSPGNQDPALPFERAPNVRSQPQLYSVSQLTQEISGRLEGLGRLRVEGEVSGLKRAASGHVYFDLKQGGAIVSSVIWRSQTARAIGFDMGEGAQVIATGKLDVYGPHGRYKLIVDRVEPLGMGQLLAQLEKLKAELREKGYFERQRSWPTLPRTIGIVTSRDGAALRDFLRTRSMRWPGYPVRLVHTPVQGPGAAAKIAQAIDRIAASGVDLIVLTRGGGSLEDLWCFNERVVAEAIWRSPVPIVSAVGHESDTSLSDLVCDHRAHTPTDAAQEVIPDRRRLIEQMLRLQGYLMAAIDSCLEKRRTRLQQLGRVLRDPRELLQERRARLELIGMRMQLGARAELERGRVQIERLQQRLLRHDPRARIERWAQRLERSGRALSAQGQRLIEAPERRLALAARSLEAISPLRVLARGYTITTAAKDGAVLLDAEEVAPGDELLTSLRSGRVRSRVMEVEPGESSANDAAGAISSGAED